MTVDDSDEVDEEAGAGEGADWSNPNRRIGSSSRCFTRSYSPSLLWICWLTLSPEPGFTLTGPPKRGAPTASASRSADDDIWARACLSFSLNRSRSTSSSSESHHMVGSCPLNRYDYVKRGRSLLKPVLSLVVQDINSLLAQLL